MLIDWLAVVTVAVCVLGGLFFAIKDKDTEPLLAWNAIWVVPIAWFLVSASLGTFLPKQPVYTRMTLTNIDDGKSQSGAFFLGIGGFQEDGKIYYYSSDNGKNMFKNVDAQNGEIYETTSKPYVMERTGCKGRWTWLVECVYWEHYAKFYVPANTIKTNYQLDAK